MCRFVKIPVQLLETKISANAKLLWIQLARMATKNNSPVWPHPGRMAEKMGLSPSTIRKLTRELVKADLLVFAGFIDGRNKTYKLVLSVVPVAIPVEPKPHPMDPVEQWRQRFPCLDGRSGRPTLEACIEEAMGSGFRKKTEDPIVWVEQWLLGIEKIWTSSYNREQVLNQVDVCYDAQSCPVQI